MTVLRTTIGIVGARGHVGRELLTLLDAHPGFELVFIGSRQLAGKRLRDLVPEAAQDLAFAPLTAADVAGFGADVCVLALPDGLSAQYLGELDRTRPQTIVLDLSGDHRFDPDWYYGLPELNRGHALDARRIANPGCYATGMQLAIAPMLDVLSGPPVCFGVSGYSGAGTTPSPKNDPEVLADNLLPYKLAGHLHEREVIHRLGHAVYFSPHVASFFRGISLTVTMPLARPLTQNEVLERYAAHHEAEPLVDVIDEIPQVRDACNRHNVTIGGFALGEDGTRLTVVATLDNLLKGAATQALQNLNLACGHGELEGIPHD